MVGLNRGSHFDVSTEYPSRRWFAIAAGYDAPVLGTFGSLQVLPRPGAINMLDRGLVAPRNLIARHAEYGSDRVAVLGTWRPASQHDRH